MKSVIALLFILFPSFLFAQNELKSERQLKDSTIRLQEIEVLGIRKTAKKMSETSARLPLKDMENPTVYSIVPREIITQVSATDFNTALQTVVGAISFEGINSSGNDVTIRGFRNTANFRNGLAVNPRTQIEIANIERIEVIKGPSGTLFGGNLASYGGVINTVTKRAYNTFGGSVKYQVGSWGLNRLSFDINTPVNKNGTLMARVNGSLHSQNSFQDNGYSKGMFLSADIVYQLSDKTKIVIDAELNTPERTLNPYVRGSEVFKKTTSSADFASISRRSFSSNDIAAKRVNYNTYVLLNHKFNNQWSSATSYQYGLSNENEVNFLVPVYKSDTSIIRKINRFDNYRVTTDNFQQNFNGDFHIGRLRNRLVVGFDYLRNKIQNQAPMFKEKGKSVPFVTYDEIILNNDAVWEPVTVNKINSLERSSTYYQISGYNCYSIYISNVLDITPSLHLLMSLRYETFNREATSTNGIKGKDGYTKNHFSPKIGLTYELLKDRLTLFGSYVNGYKYAEPSMDRDGVYHVWKPEQGKQWEGGVKLSFFDQKLTSTISYYNITVTDRVKKFGEEGFKQVPESTSKGVDAEIIAMPVNGISVIAGFSYNKTEDGQTLRRFTWTPQQMANLWISYSFQNSKLRGFGVSFGVNHAGDAMQNEVNEYKSPAYTICNGLLSYDNSNIRLSLKANNLLNTQYWDFYGKPQKPFEIIADIAYRF